MSGEDADVKYRGEALQDALAAEYVLGTLHGRARRRFEHSLHSDPGLRRRVTDWQQRLAPLNDAIEPVQPPARVWTGIERRLGIAPAATGRGWGQWIWASLAFWRGLGLIGALASVLLAGLLVLRVAQPHQMMVVVLADQQDRPAMTVSWQAHDRGDKRLRVRVIGHATMAPDTAWELWMLPEGEAKPVSLGLISTHETQFVRLPPKLAAQVDRARGLAMSVEPAGGSPTGLPTGPVLYKGACVPL
ncbi:MAG TPA: anti-sigma factor [Burkholderiales bacterium]|nr:anti-sigma factor [Burkholderiales bacterium]